MASGRASVCGFDLALASAWRVKRRRSEASLGWPMVPANIDAIGVSEDVEGGGRLDLMFSYVIADQEYRGRYSKTSIYRRDAEQLMTSLQKGPLYVRYNPSDPSDYLIDPYRDVRNT